MIPLVQQAYAWGFVSGRVAVLERALLAQDFYQSLLAHRHTEDILRQLQETPLREAVTAAGGWEDWSAIIDRHFYDHVASIRKDSPDPRVADLFVMQGDYQNLKLVLTGQTTFPFRDAVLTPDLLASAAGGDLLALPEPYRALAETATEMLEEGKNLSELDQLLDTAYLKHVLSVAEELKVPLITEYFRTAALMRSILLLWRGYLAGHTFSSLEPRLLPFGSLSGVIRDLIQAGEPKNWTDVVPGHIGDLLDEYIGAGELDGPQRFELDATNYLGDLAHQGLGQVFGPERVFSYLTSLATEAYNLKLVVSGRLSRIDTDMLKRRLRKTHA